MERFRRGRCRAGDCAAGSSRWAISTGSTSGTRRWSARAVVGARARPAGAGRDVRSAPGAAFPPRCAPFALTTIRPALDAVRAQAAVDAMFVFAFDAALAALSARRVRPATGWSTRIGAARRGDRGRLHLRSAARRRRRPMLAGSAPGHGFAATVVRAVCRTRGGRSPRPASARRCARATRCGGAAADPPFTIRGAVEHGAKLGRTLGLPDRQYRHSATICGPPTASMRCAAASTGADRRRGQPRRAADVRAAGGVARSPISSTSAATCTGGDRGRADRLPAARGEVRRASTR